MATQEASTTFKNKDGELGETQQKVVAEILGIQSATIGNRKDIFKPLPGKRGRYDLAEAVQSYIKWVKGEDEVGKTQGERGLLYGQQRRKLELQNQQESGELVNINDASGVLSEVASALRAGLTALPGRLASQLAATSKPAECRRLVADETEDLLNDFQEFLSERYPQTDPETVSNSGPGKANSKAKSKPKPGPMGGRTSKTTSRKRGAG